MIPPPGKRVFIMAQPISYLEEIKRKAVHLSSLWMVAVTIALPRFVPYGRWYAVAIFTVCAAVTLVSEHDYANGGKYLGKLYGKLFGKMLRSEVTPGQWIVSGGAPVLFAAVLVNLLFPPAIAAASLAVMLTGDAAAALCGRKFGRHKIVNGKSLEGTLSFVVVGFLFLSIVGAICAQGKWFYLAGAAATILAAVVELFTAQLKIDDNFTIPVTVGVILSSTLLF